MKFQEHRTVELTTQDIEEAVRRYVQAEAGGEVETVHFRINTVSRGFGSCEYDEHTLSGASCDMKPAP